MHLDPNRYILYCLLDSTVLLYPDVFFSSAAAYASYKYGFRKLSSYHGCEECECILSSGFSWYNTSRRMEIPVIDLGKLAGDERRHTMSALHEACEKWGFFWVEKHGIREEVMEKVKKVVNEYYEECMEERFYSSEVAKAVEAAPAEASNADWESSFFYRHQPDSNIADVPAVLRGVTQEYVGEVIKVAERLSELMSENLGLEKDHLKRAFAEPFVGAKVAKYPRCPQPELVMGLRGHTDAGGIVLLLQDDAVPGLEFLKDGGWVPVPPARPGRLFVNVGDQVEVVSNGIYKSIRHRVLADRDGSRLSIATFYNPGGDAVMSPAPRLVYPSRYRFRDYLDYYTSTKFSDKVARFQTIKDMLA